LLNYNDFKLENHVELINLVEVIDTRLRRVLPAEAGVKSWARVNVNDSRCFHYAIIATTQEVNALRKMIAPTQTQVPLSKFD
jgi:hypothetical protein